MQKILIRQIAFIVLMIVISLPSITNALPSNVNVDYYSSKNNFSSWEDMASTNSIQDQLYKICYMELGASIEKISENNYLIKADKQLDEDDVIAYDVTMDSLNINGVYFDKNVRLEFYQGKLENVRFKFDADGDKLKEFLINNWGIAKNSIAISDKVRYTWQDGDYQARLFTDGEEGFLVFYYMPYAKNANKIKRLEYAEHLKTSPEAINRLENLIKNSEQFKASFKQELQNDPDYAEALQEAGMNMNIFN